MESILPRRVKKLSARHLSLMKLMIERPSLTLAECGAVIGYSACQVSRIVNSAPFRERLTGLHIEALEAAMHSSLGRGLHAPLKPPICPVSLPFMAMQPRTRRHCVQEAPRRVHHASIDFFFEISIGNARFE